jgi:hypothetical protein
MGNAHLMAARKRKYDEYYTSYEDIEREMIHYKPSFKGKRIYCNCDDRSSAFYKYFKDKFHEFGLKALMVTGIKGEKCLFDGVREYVSDLEDGRFQSDECRELLKWCDMVVTNPPFSLWREYFDLVIESGKEFILLGCLQCFTYVNVFPHYQNNEIWFGTDKAIQNYWFDVPSKTLNDMESVFHNGRRMVKRRQIVWLTNLHHDVPKHLEATAKYNRGGYQHYVDYDAIEIGRIKDIPCDYDGVMGVPITFPLHHDPEQFEVVGIVKPHMPDGTAKYERYLIKKKA